MYYSYSDFEDESHMVWGPEHKKNLSTQQRFAVLVYYEGTIVIGS